MIISGQRERTDTERAANAALCASALHNLGVEADDCVAIYLRNDFEFFEASAACALLGAYATPVNWHYTASEAGYILNDCDARVLIIHSDLLPGIVEGVPAETSVVVVPTPEEITGAYRCDDHLQALPAMAKKLPGRLYVLSLIHI